MFALLRETEFPVLSCRVASITTVVIEDVLRQFLLALARGRHFIEGGAGYLGRLFLLREKQSGHKRGRATSPQEASHEEILRLRSVKIKPRPFCDIQDVAVSRKHVKFALPAGLCLVLWLGFMQDFQPVARLVSPPRR